MAIIFTSFLAVCCGTLTFQYTCYLQYAREKEEATEIIPTDLATSN